MSLEELQAHLRLLRKIPKFLRDVITYEESVSEIKRRLANREEAFLQIAEQTIFKNPRSPYLPLLKMADCGLGDLRNMIAQDGLEKTLHQLDEAGVYIRFEEFKGREPIVRQGKEIPVLASDFDNPLITSHLLNRTSGSTGSPTSINTDLDMIADLCHTYLIAYVAHDNMGVPTTIWGAPAGGGNPALSEAKIGRSVDRWFTPVPSRELQRTFAVWAARSSVAASGRLAGVRLPRLEFLPHERAEVLVHWVAGVVKSLGQAVVQTTPSLAVRACTIANRIGIDLSGVTFNQSGEPTTEAKRREITSTGAVSTSYYATAETGVLALPCAMPRSVSDDHLISDLWALITHPREIPLSGASVNALVLTSLHKKAPKIMLNVESDDYAAVETRNCGCLLGEVGFATHLSEIFSFSKLTSEGVTLVGNEMLRILEEVLPARFGGGPLDYQLLEEEDEEGLTKVSIVVSPYVRLENDQEVVDAVLEAMKPIKRGMDRAIFREGATFRVKRMEPVVTGRGSKLIPLHSKRNRAAPGENE